MIFLLIFSMCLVVIAVALESLENTWRWSVTSGAVGSRRFATSLSTDVRLRYREKRIGRTKEKEEKFNLDEKKNRARQFRRSRHQSDHSPKDNCWDSGHKSEG